MKAERTAFELVESVTVVLWDRLAGTGYMLEKVDREALESAYFLVANLRDEIAEEVQA